VVRILLFVLLFEWDKTDDEFELNTEKPTATTEAPEEDPTVTTDTPTASTVGPGPSTTLG
jgi:hypothetical protein